MAIKRVIETINRGGFGIVDKVELNTGQLAARKTFDPTMKASLKPELLEKFRLRFTREVKVQESLDAELIMPIFFYDLECASPYFVMPLAQGDYSEEINRQKAKNAIPEGLSDILNSLEHLHDLGLVHRDLKPQNILKHNDKWKLSDLGLISSDKEILSMSITSSNANGMGTPMYCAPEQVHNFKRVTHKADIYSFGALLHDIFSGNSRTPYNKQTADGPIGLIIEKCTEENPDKRFENVGELRTALLSILTQQDAKPADKSLDSCIEELDNVANWDFDQFEKFYFTIKKSKENVSPIWFKMDVDTFSYLYNIDVTLWETLVLDYFDWILTTGFSYDYCDVLIVKIKSLYDISNSILLKAKAVLIGARLGAYYNRWYVMHRVIDMASKSIDSKLAQRISIEIHVGGTKVKEHFRLCAKQIGFRTTTYHDVIAKVLE